MLGFRDASDLFVGTRTGGGDLTICLSNELIPGWPETHFQCFRNGRLDVWSTGRPDAVDLELIHVKGRAAATILGMESGNEALENLRRASGEELPPNDVGSADAMPIYKGATLSVRYEVYASPMGDVQYTEEFVDGRLAGYSRGSYKGSYKQRADVRISTSYSTVLRYRLGEYTIHEALLRAKVWGPEEALDVAAALLESEPYRRHLRKGSSDAMRALILLSGHYSSPQWRAAQDDAKN
jgi:hypothetical protein